MIRYRPFRNDDPPALVELWRSQPPRRALVPSITTELLEERIFGKPYFDREGLIVAENGGRVVGFAHAGFGSNADGSNVTTEIGSTYLMLIAGHERQERIARELLEQSEQYLIGHGTRTLMAGSVYPANAFYLGLYGGSPSPGVLESDVETLTLFRSAGYGEVSRHFVLQRALAGFRPLVDRSQLQIRRQYRVETDQTPAVRSWWEACTIGMLERVQHRVLSSRTGAVCGCVTFWDLTRQPGAWGAHEMGLIDLEIKAEGRHQGLGTFLVGEALKHMHAAGMALAEAQIDEQNQPALGLFRKLGFGQVDRGIVLRKNA
jgi:ribosomal protein S18 acetylase RimI-like enzyme